MEVTATVWDGQTIVIGYRLDDRHPAEDPDEKRLLVMISATLVDPAGNRYHTDEEVQAMRNGDGKASPARPVRSRRAPVPGAGGIR
jgi:hypothetical protein